MYRQSLGILIAKINAVKIQYATGLNLTKGSGPIRNGLLCVIVLKDLGPRFLPMPLMDKQFILNRFKSVLYKQDHQYFYGSLVRTFLPYLSSINVLNFH